MLDDIKYDRALAADLARRIAQRPLKDENYYGNIVNDIASEVFKNVTGFEALKRAFRHVGFEGVQVNSNEKYVTVRLLFYDEKRGSTHAVEVKRKTSGVKKDFETMRQYRERDGPVEIHEMFGYNSRLRHMALEQVPPVPESLNYTLIKEEMYHEYVIGNFKELANHLERTLGKSKDANAKSSVLGASGKEDGWFGKTHAGVIGGAAEGIRRFAFCGKIRNGIEQRLAEILKGVGKFARKTTNAIFQRHGQCYATTRRNTEAIAALIEENRMEILQRVVEKSFAQNIYNPRRHRGL
ncbi:hypothetical protein [Hydrogenimonas urashimensis]|uniref:hypothetical protein n=1 Tax=Hydrogenimonas urashimensis TaxID=2740515 RepID=UPI0019169BF1|nr:hypothetical protein [Hydrogenimonas urashimensis]